MNLIFKRDIEPFGLGSFHQWIIVVSNGNSEYGTLIFTVVCILCQASQDLSYAFQGRGAINKRFESYFQTKISVRYMEAERKVSVSSSLLPVMNNAMWFGHMDLTAQSSESRDSSILPQPVLDYLLLFNGIQSEVAAQWWHLGNCMQSNGRLALQ